MKQIKPTTDQQLYLEKGQAINFIGYTIINCTNNDGLVLSSPNDEHCGNYGIGLEKNVDNAKQAALIHFMIDRPVFYASIRNKILSSDSSSGTHSEWYLLRNALKEAGFDMPKEVTQGDTFNYMIYYKGKPLQWIK